MAPFRGSITAPPIDQPDEGFAARKAARVVEDDARGGGGLRQAGNVPGDSHTFVRPQPMSGYGREGSVHGLDDYMPLKYLRQGQL